MKPDLSSIANPQVRHFYILWWPQHEILCDFFNLLPEAQFDFRLVDRPARQADTPRQSLAHLLYVERVYLHAVVTGELDFKSHSVEPYAGMTKSQLLAEWDRVDRELFANLLSPSFDSQSQVQVPWGGSMNLLDLLFFLRDHDILHIGWNLALMDALELPRYASLARYWG